MKANVWFTIPKENTVTRGSTEEKAVRINQGFANSPEVNVLGVDNGLTLSELENLLWRVKQGIHLLRYGKLLGSKP